MGSIYLDYNATTPVDPEVVQAMLPVLYGKYGNPSSSHPFGREAKKIVEDARRDVAGLLHCGMEEIVFTSGGTESNNYALKGAAFQNRSRGNHIITSAVEHPAILEVYAWLKSQGFRISVLPVDTYGMVKISDLEQVIEPQTILVSIMHANNEVGTIQPIADLARVAHQYGALFHSDAAQSIGKISVDVLALGVDLLSVAGHKVYAPKGIGALYIRSGVHLEKFMHGAGHEAGRRAGTENVLEIVGLGTACRVAQRDLDENRRHYQMMRDRLQEGLMQSLGESRVRINGHPTSRLPNTLNISFYRIEANRLLERVADKVSASAGAACHAEDIKISSVLQAMQTSLEWAMGTVRFSTGRDTTTGEIDEVIRVMTEGVQSLERDNFSDVIL